MFNATSMRPRYEHTCSCCVFIGTTHGPNLNLKTGEFTAEDWYLCIKPSGAGADLLARFNDEGPDYWSMDIGMFKLMTAGPNDYGRATASGLSRTRTEGHDQCEADLRLSVRHIVAQYMLDRARAQGLLGDKP